MLSEGLHWCPSTRVSGHEKLLTLLPLGSRGEAGLHRVSHVPSPLFYSPQWGISALPIKHPQGGQDHGRVITQGGLAVDDSDQAACSSHRPRLT